MRRVLSLFSLLLLAGCETFAENPVDAPAPQASASAPAVAPASAEQEIELRLAKLWSRVDELEAQLLAQKERTRVLEKGMTLGLIPSELQQPDPRPAKIEALKKQSDLPPVVLPPDGASAAPSTAVPEGVALVPGESTDTESYRKLLQQAQDKFNRAEYGQAIVLFNDIGAKYSDGLSEGSHHYWIGLSWFYLKEYRLSEESFQAFKTRYPTSPWFEHAQFYEAKILQARGLNRQALEAFQKVLERNPERDLGEMAQSEINRMKEKL